MTALHTLTDDELLRRLQTGDEAAFTTLYRRRQGGVYRYALQMSGNVVIAEEVTQDTFLALFQDGHRFDSARGTVSSYLYGIARNLVLRNFEKAQRWVELEDDDAGALPDLSAEDPLSGLTRRETIDAVRKAIESLPEAYREVVVLCDLEDLSYEEAAAVLGCALGTIRSRLHRARALLSEKLRVTERPALKVESPVGEVRLTDGPGLLKAARCAQ
jgi:RNA polymerase sigma-70 factor (ECF subfamily)